MKPHIHILRLVAVAVAFAALIPLSLAAEPKAAPTTAPAKPEMPKAVFVHPENPNQGRDPFFPNSMRPYQGESKAGDSASLTDLYVKSILQAGDRVFAVINNHAFAPGDDGVVLAKDGRRISIRCIAIDPKAGTVMVESGNAKAVLHFSMNP